MRVEGGKKPTVTRPLELTMFRKPLLAFTGVAALSALAFAPLVNPGTVASADGKARAAAAGTLDVADIQDVQRFQPLPCVVEMAGPFQCNNVDLVDNVPTPLFGGVGHGSDSWGWTDDNDTPEDPSDDTDYVVVTSGDGHGFLRLAEDGTAEYLGTLPRAYFQDDGGTPVLWNDVKVVNDHAYITAEDSSSSQQYGIQVVDMNRVADLEAQDPTQGLKLIEQDGHLDNGLAGHNLVAFPERGLLGVVLGEHEECGGNLVFFDAAADPVNPPEIGCAWPEGDLNYADTPHDAHCVIYHGPDPDYNGAGDDGVLGTDDDTEPRDVCALFSQYTGGAILLDTTELTRDRTSDRATFVNRFTYDTLNYTHQGWFTENHRWVMFNDELDESGAAALGLGGSGASNPNGNNRTTTTYYIDLTDLDVQEGPLVPGAEDVNESLVNKWSNPNTLSIDHNMYPVGNHLYQANYGAGLRVLEFSDESLEAGGQDAFEEVAYFDTYPGPGPSEFYGAWNVYPFFGPDRIILSDFQAGLLVLDIHDEVFESDEG